ncbi:MAG: neutral ceramidase [Candidatus Azotimanducaceae bacterium]|jgi:neutral ceramidase
MKIALALLIITLMTSVNAKSKEPYEFVIGRGMADVTGPAFGIQLWGFGREDQISEGLHTRQSARAFIIADGDQAKRVAFVSVDIGSIEHHITLEVLDRLKQQFGETYRLDNIILSATHTHSAPSGYWHSRSKNGLDGGFYPEHFDNIVEGIVEAVIKAHEDLQPGNIYVNKGRVENAGINRSLIAYEENPASERAGYADTIDKDMTLLKFVDDSGDIGMINWLAVHPTSMTFFNRLISGDHKGYASLNIERKKGVTYQNDSEFVAAFAQTNAGDVTPNLNLDNTGPGKDDFDSTKIIGQRQVDVALKLFANASELLKGEIDSRQIYIDMSQYEVKDEFTGAGVQRTCPSAYGYSFAGGSTEDGGGHFLFREGMTEQNIFLDFLVGILLDAPKWTESVRQCQSPKAILFVTGAGDPPQQSQIRSITIVRIGQVAILALPTEITTMAGRRLRDTVQAHLGDRATHVVLAGYSNGYAGYVTTPEEYLLQQYEAGHTLHGRWTLPAYQQVAAELATALKNKSAVKQSLVYDDWRGKSPMQQLYDASAHGSDNKSAERPIKDITQDIAIPLDKKKYEKGDVITASFYSGNPTATYDREQIFMGLEILQGTSWIEIGNDYDWSTKIRWVLDDESEGLIARLSWQSAEDSQPGQYRIRHKGNFTSSDGAVESINETSDSFYLD